MSRGIVYDSDYGHELVIVQNEQYAVLTHTRDDVVYADYVRIIDKKDYGREIVYWNLEEIAEDVKDCSEDPATALNAILSAIELVATNNFPPEGFKIPDTRPALRTATIVLGEPDGPGDD